MVAAFAGFGHPRRIRAGVAAPRAPAVARRSLWLNPPDLNRTRGEGMGTSTLPGSMTGEEIVALTKKHTIFEWTTQANVDPIPVAGAKGSWFWTPEGKRYLDFNSQLMCTNIGHGDERVVRAHPGAGRHAGVRQPVHGHGAAGAPRGQAGRDHARRHRHVLLHERRRRGERERDQDRPALHRPPEDPRPGTARITAERPARSRSRATRVAGPPSRAWPASSISRTSTSGAAGIPSPSTSRCATSRT